MLLKKITAALVAAAFILTGPGRLTAEAAAGLSRNGAPQAPALAAPAVLGLDAIQPIMPGAAPSAPIQAAVERLAQAPAIQTLQKQGPAVSDADRRQALDATFDFSLQKPGQTMDVQGRESSVSAGLEPAGAGRASAVAKLSARVESSKSQTGSLVAEIGIVAGVAAVLGAIFSPSFRNHLKRMGQVLLGWIGLGVKKAETPDVIAIRIVDQLNAAKPVYNQKVQQASTLTEKIAIQVRDEKAKAAELEKTINALLSDKDDSNDHLAAGMIAAQKNLQASIAAGEEQLKLAQASLEKIKAERARFFQEHEEMLAKVNAQLTRAKSAEIQKQMAELKGGFQVGDIKDSMDRLNDIVNEKEAEAKGSKDAAETNPDEIIKKAKESVMNSEVKDEIARRKAEIARKQQEGKDKTGSKVGSSIASLAWIGSTLIPALFASIRRFKIARVALLASVLTAATTGCSGQEVPWLDLDGTWLVDLHSKSKSDTGAETTADFPGYELIVDQFGPSVLFANVVGHAFGDKISLGANRAGTLSEDGNWERGWWSLRADGWAEKDKAELEMRIEIWDSGDTEILGLDLDYEFTNFRKLTEPERPTFPAP